MGQVELNWQRGNTRQKCGFAVTVDTKPHCFRRNPAAPGQNIPGQGLCHKAFMAFFFRSDFAYGFRLCRTEDAVILFYERPVPDLIQTGIIQMDITGLQGKWIHWRLKFLKFQLLKFHN
jgi:hypothetical protein